MHLVTGTVFIGTPKAAERVKPNADQVVLVMRLISGFLLLPRFPSNSLMLCQGFKVKIPAEEQGTRHDKSQHACRGHRQRDCFCKAELAVWGGARTNLHTQPAGLVHPRQPPTVKLREISLRGRWHWLGLPGSLRSCVSFGFHDRMGCDQRKWGLHWSLRCTPFSSFSETQDLGSNAQLLNFQTCLQDRGGEKKEM